MINKVILIGRLTNDPQMRATNNDTSVCSLNLAVNEKSRDSEHTEFVRVSAFSRLAEICGQYLKKGSLVYIEGKLRTRKYQDRDGIEKQLTEVLADSMKMLDSKSKSTAPGASNDSFNDDIPF